MGTEHSTEKCSVDRMFTRNWLTVRTAPLSVCCTSGNDGHGIEPDKTATKACTSVFIGCKDNTETKRKKKKRSVWVKPWLCNNVCCGSWREILSEILRVDTQDMQQYHRMTSEMFNTVLERIRSLPWHDVAGTRMYYHATPHDLSHLTAHTRVQHYSWCRLFSSFYVYTVYTTNKFPFSITFSVYSWVLVVLHFSCISLTFLISLHISPYPFVQFAFLCIP